MSTETKTKKMPKLRFAGYSGEWEEKNLGEIGEPLMCKRIFKEETTSNPNNGIPFYKIGTFGREADSYISKEIYEEYKSKYSFPKIGDILISASGTIGRLVIYDGAPAFFQDSNIIWLGHNEEKVQNKFLFYCYSTLRWQTSDGGVISRLYNSDFKGMRIHYPINKKEQQKIADCLSSLDELITAHNQKLEALQAHKKGLMQQLFPAEGETVPKLRFEEFRDSGEWEEKTLEGIADIKRGAASQHLKYVDGNNPLSIRLLRINDFINDDAVYVEDTEDMKRFRVQADDILIAGTGATAGITFMVPKKFDNLSYSYNAPRIRVKNANKYFVYHYLKSDSILQQQKKLFVGNAQPFLDTSAIGSFKLFSPSPDEQQKIAECLSSLDKLITAQTEKIEGLQKHKKGLMQGLFPTKND